jgi:hypothetical protein
MGEVIGGVSLSLQESGALDLVFKPSLVQKLITLNRYKTLTRPVLTFGKRLSASKMEFVRTSGYTLLDHKRN